ncbi:3-oxoacyl-[acyl-carrier-protein] synthase-3 [Bryocella elongata]|uniref:3-oxoacyl-[acyl-carrier-protein] synthase-3 n=1 Tax=Bryocella elongata TaxID=863522 RepID=A0A1H5S0T3_9BACT|nr:StlD/DarB family beta-ketosynthase [Bryocella elongata]SEF43447.1 3-oxoacyl-[acyl-carrier-protein] synthase-3 [Bryocella elongata]
MNAYITSLGKFLPGEPVANDDMESHLGLIAGKPSRVRQRILKQNGIQSRHYAIDRQQRSLFSNAEMTANAARCAVARGGLALADIDFIAAATSQADLPLPGFASMVHGELKSPPCEVTTVHGICASGLMAMKAAALQVSAGKQNALACAGEFASRLFKASRFDDQELVREEGLGFDAEFLRWMLSDGAGAAMLCPAPAPNGLSLRIDWIELRSFANNFEPCMYVGPAKQEGRIPQSWLDYSSYRAAADAGAINLRQDIRMLKEVVRHAVGGLLQVAKEKSLAPEEVDWLAVHYSSNFFREQSAALATKAGFHIPSERWFSNLSTTGNVGSASTFLLLEELLYSGKLLPGQKVLCLVPESGRFIFGYMLLTVVSGAQDPMPSAPPLHAEPPRLDAGSTPLAQQLTRELSLVWFDLEDRMQRVPLLQKLYAGRFTIEDYRSFLFNLRQQVIDGSRWIARAASSITPEYLPIRSAFIQHTSDEHRDFEMLERNFVSTGGSIEEIRTGRKNIGSEALSAYILERAGHENPFDLIGAMFIVEGIGQRLARQWGERIQATLQLKDDAVSFFLYHSESDIVHFQRLDLALASGILTPPLVEAIVRCARVTARLYVLQLEEIGNF